MARGANVRLFHNTPQGIRPSSRESSIARMRLKLYALAWVESRHGIDASEGMSWDALVIYCEAAKNYVGALENQPKGTLLDRTIHEERGRSGARTHAGSDRVAAARAELKIAALGYEAMRRGADSYTQGAQSGLAMVCQAAIRYVEALEGGSDKSHLSDRLGLED